MDTKDQTVFSSNFLKCGDAIVSRDHSIFAVNCLYCKAIFLQLTHFTKHILEVHNAELEIENQYNEDYIYEDDDIKEDATKDVGEKNYTGTKIESNIEDVQEATETTSSQFDNFLRTYSPFDSPDNHDSDSMAIQYYSDCMTTESRSDIDCMTSLPECVDSDFTSATDADADAEEAMNGSAEEDVDGVNMSIEFISDECDISVCASRTEVLEEQTAQNTTSHDHHCSSLLTKTAINSNLTEAVSESELLFFDDEDSYFEQFKDYFYETDDGKRLTPMESKNVEDCCEENTERKPSSTSANTDDFLMSLKNKCKNFPEIWNPSHPNFSDKQIRLMALKHLTKLMKLQYPATNIQLRNIRLQLRKIRQDIEEEFNSSLNYNNFDCEQQQSESEKLLTAAIPAKFGLGNDVDFALIELYEKEKCLWSVEHPKFTDKNARSLAYLHITNELNRIFYSGERHKLKVKELRLRITQLCDWYKAQLRSKFRCKMLDKPFQAGNELRFKQFGFLKTIFEPVIEREEFKIREEMESEYLQRDDPFVRSESNCIVSTVSGLVEKNNDTSINRDSERESSERNMSSLVSTSSSFECTKQERLETMRIIETYRKYPILWNPQLPDSHSFKAKRTAMEDMAKILTEEYLMPMNGEIVRLRLKNIRNQYKFHLKKIESGIKSKLWFAPQLDEFLKEHIKTSLRRVNSDEVVKKMPASLDLPFRFEANMSLNIDLIDTLRNSPGLWQSEDLTFQISTELLHDVAFHNLMQLLNKKHGMQLDENNMLMLLHDLFEWFKREMARKQYCNEQQSPVQTTFTPSSMACWERMQFMADYKFLPDAYTCATCHKSTKSINAYLVDRGQHVSQQPYKCFYCDKRFMDITNCRTHECRIHRKIYNYGCDFCSRKFAHSTDALVHRRRFHTQERLYVCEICGKAFISAYEMKRHRKFHSRNTEYECKICKLVFTLRRQLNDHKKTEHDRKTSNICKFCENVFPTISKLKKHMQTECNWKMDLDLNELL